MRTMLSDLLKRVAESSGKQLDMWLNTADQLLRLLRVNLDRLVTCNVNPEFGGIHLYGGRTPCAPNTSRVDTPMANLPRCLSRHRYPKAGKTPTLAPLLDLLNSIVEGDYPKKLQHAAVAAVDTGLTVLYPTVAKRRELLQSLVQAVR